nr:hypothetical protein [Candidatus Cloacimonadota bacterium]
MFKIFISVGTNPIPCFISGLYLLDCYARKPELELILLCSKEDKTINQAGTCSIGERIKEQIEKQDTKYPESPKIKLLEIEDVASEQSIVKALRGSYTESDEIHFNYTGGTKSMVAITYSILKDQENFSSSYMDVHRHAMIVDVDPTVSKDLRENPKLRLDLQTIASLHGVDDIKYKNYLKDAYLPLFNYVTEKLQNEENKEVYKSIKAFKKSSCSEESKDEIIARLEELIKESGLDQNKGTRKEAAKFIDGLWLEYYIYEELKNNDKNIKFYHDVKKEMEKEKEKEKEKGKDTQFQIDVIATYGYQLTLISITTDNTKSLCKLKLFEAYFRAHQLGGDAAKIVMVTFLIKSQVIELKEDIRRLIGSTSSNIEVIGIEEFYDHSFHNKILSHITR